MPFSPNVEYNPQNVGYNPHFHVFYHVIIEIMKYDVKLLDLAVQTLCITRIIKNYCEANMSSDEHCENIFALMEVMEKTISDELQNY
ncbi:hypothetical protein IJ843_02930 [bacterium]|nr:hypothetical protein [bacterium]